jgi:hypothetical protein
MRHLDHQIIFVQMNKSHRPLFKLSILNFAHRQYLDIVMMTAPYDPVVKTVDLIFFTLY